MAKLGRSLAHVGILNASDLAIRQTANRANIMPFLEDMPIPANSDYFPYVDLNAGRALFTGSNATFFEAWMTTPLPVLEMLNQTNVNYASVSPGQALNRAESIDAASWLFEKMTKTKIRDPQGNSVKLAPLFVLSTDWLISSQQSCLATSNPQRWFESVFELLSFTLPILDPQEAELLVSQVAISGCELVENSKAAAWLDLYYSIAIRDAEAMFRSGSELLLDAANMSAREQAYVISATMLGALVSGHPLDAYEVWMNKGMPFYMARPMPPYVTLIVSLSARYEDPS